MRQSAEARLHSRMLLGFCNDGFLATETIMTRLLGNAKSGEESVDNSKKIVVDVRDHVVPCNTTVQSGNS